MAIVKLRPAFKDYLWGGQKLKEDYNKETSMNPLAESWEVSTHLDGPSMIVGGIHHDKTLREYIEIMGRQVLGTNGQKFDEFPILVKFIDALQDLSIQVHPEDKYALEHENEYGKTEMWYILEAEPNAKLYYGTKEEITKEEYAASIADNTILDKLNHVNVTKGDVIFVEAGTIHAIGAGIVICEIQQNSNTTYRVYDFDRKDAQGNTRELHVEKALDVSTLTPLNTSFKAQGELVDHGTYTTQELVSCDYFTTTKVVMDGAMEYNLDDTSFEAIIILEGQLYLEQYGKTMLLSKGDSVFIEAGTPEIKPHGTCEYLSVRV